MCKNTTIYILLTCKPLTKFAFFATMNMTRCADV